MEFRAKDWPAPEPNASKNTYLSNFMATEKLVLKVGAQVMLIKNLDATLVNGTIGKVVGFGYLDLDESDEESEIKMEGASDAAQARKKAKVVASAAQGEVEMSPLIEWRTPGGSEKKLMAREEFKVEDMKGQKLASRTQVRSSPTESSRSFADLSSDPSAVPNHSVGLEKSYLSIVADSSSFSTAPGPCRESTCDSRRVLADDFGPAAFTSRKVRLYLESKLISARSLRKVGPPKLLCLAPRSSPLRAKSQARVTSLSVVLLASRVSKSCTSRQTKSPLIPRSSSGA